MKLSYLTLIAVVSVCVASCAPQQGAVIRKKGNGFELRVDGEKSYIKGVGGTNRLDVASASGANACRTWGGDVKSVRRTSELAAKSGMRVMLRRSISWVLIVMARFSKSRIWWPSQIIKVRI